MHETDIFYKKYLFYTYITSTKKLRNEVQSNENHKNS